MKREKARLILRLLVGTVLIASVALMVRGFVAGQEKGEREREKEEGGVKATARVSVEKGETVIKLDAAAQRRIGLAIVSLEAVSNREQIQAFGVVLPVQDLVDLRNSFVAAQARVEKAHIALDLAQKEASRLMVLYEDNRNASEKSLQAAESTVRADQADLHAAEQELSLAISAARQRWGSVVASWLAEDSPSLRRVLDQSEMLVQVTLPPGEQSEVPQKAFLEIPAGGRVQALLISALPRVDPRIQGASYLYRTGARPALMPGINLVARLPVGGVRKGVLVPEAAVVWLQGKAWIYQQTSPDEFRRREVPTDRPIPKGWFVSRDFSVGDRIVVTGAQALFSEEFRAQTRVPEEE